MPELTKFGKKLLSFCKSEEEFVEVYKLYADEIHGMCKMIKDRIDEFFKEEVLSCFVYDEELIRRIKEAWRNKDA